MKRALSFVLFAVLALGCVFALFLPFSKEVECGEVYACVWANGETTEESYASASANLVGITEAGNMSLLRDERYGEIEGSDALRAFLAAADSTDALSILSLRADALAGLERAAVNLYLKDRLWYAGGFFGWTGEDISETKVGFCRRLVVLAGALPADALLLTGAEELVLSAQGDAVEALHSAHFVQKIFAEPPYSVEAGALYLEAAGGRRLVAALANAAELTVEDVSFIDRGALLSCNRLVSLDVPFAGSASSGIGTNYDGLLAHLFSAGAQYEIPKTLVFVRVRGGTLVSHAFYRFKDLSEIDVCGVARGNIATDAFIDCISLRRLHTPKYNVALPAAGFVSSVLPCGCTLYARA